MAHPKKTKTAYIKAHFKLDYGDWVDLFTRAAYGDYNAYVSNITDPLSRWTATYLLHSKD